jgi:hypothetical protein
MKTALQDFIDKNFYIDADGEYVLKWVEDTPLTDEINEALEKEKKQIEKAFRKGSHFQAFGGSNVDTYYTETYKD